MGVIIKTDGVVKPSNRPAILPVEEGLIGYYLFSNELENSGVYNKKLNGEQPTIVKEIPEGFNGYARFKDKISNINTNINELPEFSFIVLARNTSNDSKGMIISNTGNRETTTPNVLGYGSSLSLEYNLNESTGLYVNSARLYATRYSTTDLNNNTTSSSSIPLNNQNTTNWTILSGRAKDSSSRTVMDGYSELRNHTLGTSINRLLGKRVLSLDTLNIGGTANSNSYLGAIDISAVLIYDRFISDGELDIIVDMLQKRKTRYKLV